MPMMVCTGKSVQEMHLKLMMLMMFVCREHMKLMLENAFTLPRHSDRNASLADSIGNLMSSSYSEINPLVHLLVGPSVYNAINIMMTIIIIVSPIYMMNPCLNMMHHKYCSPGQYIMRKFGRLGLLTGTQPFYPTQFHRFVSFKHHIIIPMYALAHGAE